MYSTHDIKGKSFKRTAAKVVVGTVSLNENVDH